MSPRIRWSASSVLTVVLALISLAARPALAQQFVSFDPPGSSATFPGGINDAGQIVGNFTDANGSHGFLLSGGVYTTIDFPSALATTGAGINNSGQIVGSYTDANNLNHGFLLSAGTFTSFDDPALPEGTFPVQIDDLGNIVGFGIDAQGITHGFFLSKISGGTYTPIDFPNAKFTEPLDMNFNGTIIVGAYALPSFPKHTSQGFTDINGTLTSVTFPGSVSTGLNGVSNNGQVAGTYALPDQNTAHAFLQNGSTFTTEDFPGAVSTFAANINDLGQIVGGYYDADNVAHGYLMTSGPFAYIANPGGTVSLLDTSTNLVVTAIPVPGEPWDLVMTPDQKHVYVTELAGASVAVIATATNTVVASIPVGSVPYSITIAPNGNFAYVTNDGDNTVSVISTASNTVVATVQVGNFPVASAVTPDSTLVYVSNYVGSTISVINTATNTVTSTFSITTPVGLAFTGNGAFAYVTNFTNPGTVTVLAVPSNEIVTTIQLGTPAAPIKDPIEVAITPDQAFAYVTDDGSGTVSVINIASNSIVTTIPVGKNSVPFRLAISPDGSLVYVGGYNSETVSVIQTSSNTVVATVAFPGGVSGIAIASAQPTSQTVTQPLIPKVPNVFNFGTNSQTVQYPPGVSFSNVVMNTVAQQITPAQFQQRVAGTQFANATCIVYSGNGGNCVDYLVTCTDDSGNQKPCPSEAQPTIAVQTGFSTAQSITNPGYLTTPIGQNEWQNIFTGFSDPTVHGKTTGFSEFVAVALGASNAQGLAKFQLLKPSCETRKVGEKFLYISFQLTSLANGTPVTDADADTGISVTMIADANGNPTSQAMFSAKNVFRQPSPGVYRFGLSINLYPAGTYNVNIYGNAFPANQFQFKVVP